MLNISRIIENKINKGVTIIRGNKMNGLENEHIKIESILLILLLNPPLYSFMSHSNKTYDLFNFITTFIQNISLLKI